MLCLQRMFCFLFAGTSSLGSFCCVTHFGVRLVNDQSGMVDGEWSMVSRAAAGTKMPTTYYRKLFPV